MNGNSLDSAHELILGIAREILAYFSLILILELHSELFKVVGVKLYVLSYALFLFHSVYKLLKIFLADFHNNVGIHLNKSSVAVPSPSRIA